MCGIAGFSGKKDSNKLGLMLDTIKHRGPDGEGRHETAEFSIGMRRLAIIDPNGGKQPIWNEDKTICIVYNGEMYNYQALWNELVAKGHKFSTDHSDTETIVHGYEEWGTDVLQKLQGMFAFAIYDSKKKQLFIARDRLGIKPLYYTNIGGHLHFASEIKSLLAAGAESKLNKEILYEYLMFRTHDHRQQTFFAGIEKLPAAHYMVINESGEIIKQEKYWEPKINLEFSSKKSDAEYASELRELFISTVKSHVISDVPVGVTLSGGLDSTGVVSVMANLQKGGEDLHTKNLLTFSAVYPKDKIDESHYIDLAANYVKSEQHKVTPTMTEFWNDLDNWLYTQEEPTISSAPYAIYSVMREAHKYVKVMLSGQGGDELFAGYIPYFVSYVKSALAAGKYYNVIREFMEGYDLYASFLKQQLKAKLANTNIVKMSTLVNNASFANRNFHYDIEANLNKRLYNDMTKFSVPNVLRYEDKNAMAFSVETRVPFLDHKFVEYVLQLPIDQKIKHGWNRYVYRNAMKGLIPEEIRRRRKKIGFTTPEVTWLKQNSAVILNIFASPEFAATGIFNPVHVVNDFTSWVAGEKMGDGLIFWRVLNTHLWIRRFNVQI